MCNHGGTLYQGILTDALSFFTDLDNPGSFEYREKYIDRCGMFLE
jgi:hypothetical protein